MIRSILKTKIEKVIRKKFGQISIPAYTLEAPENPEHGDYATNAALALAKVLKQNPMEVATMLESGIRNQESWEIKIAAPGFLNFFLPHKTLEQELWSILTKKAAYGRGSKKKEKIQVEFVSANPTGPLTLANGRGGFLGDVLAGVLKHQGYRVEREYYINDTGKQVVTLGLSVAASAGLADLGENYYRGPHIDAWAKKHTAFIRKNLAKPELIGQRVASDFLRQFIKPAVKKKMGITFHRWTSERSVIKSRTKKIEELFRTKELVYEKEGAVWLKTTQFGDDKDRVIKTSDGFPTYFFNDAAHYFETKKRGFSGKINFLGADHHGYVARIQAIAQIVGLKNSDIIVFQLVRLISGGQEVRMSKRRGTFVTIDELIDDVGQDAARFFFLEKSAGTHLDFDLDLAKKKSQKNPVYYVQYAHARLSSILRKVKNKKIKNKSSSLRLLKTDEEHALIKKLAQFPEVVEDVANDYQVQRLPRYALELARTFHHFYEKHRVITDDASLTEARVALIQATKIVLQETLHLLGIAAPEKM